MSGLNVTFSISQLKTIYIRNVSDHLTHCKQEHPTSIFGNDLRSRIFGTFNVKFITCLVL